MDESINETPQADKVEAPETVATYEITAENSEEATEVESEPTRAEVLAAAYKASIDAALKSSFTRAQRKAVTAKRKAAHRSRMANKGAKRVNRNRSGVTYR